MLIRIAELKDIDLIKQYDKHIAETELTNALKIGRIIIAEEDNNDFIGWLRYNYFWDNTPFMNMLYVLDKYRNKGYGKALVEYWEGKMRGLGFDSVLTSTPSNESSQHFYNKLGYKTIGGFLMSNEPYELILSKEL